MKIELEPEQVDEIVAAEMRYIIDVFEEYLEDSTGMIFSTDPIEDAETINLMIKAFNVVLSYYGEQ